MRLALARVLVGDEAEAGGAVGEGGAEDGDVLLVGGEDDGVAAAGLGGLAVVGEVGAHLADELAGAVGAGLEGVGDLVGGLVADAELFFVDEGVVDAVDHQLAEVGVACAVLVLVAGDVVVEAEGLEEVLIDDVGAGGDDGVDHVVADEVDEDLLEAGGDERAGEAEDDAAVGVAEHHVVDVGGAVRCHARSRPCCAMASTRGTTLCCLMSRCWMGRLEEFFFGRHSFTRISTFWAGLARVLCEFNKA